MTPPPSIRPAAAADRTQVEALLRSEALPLDGLAENFEHVIVAAAAGEIVGCAGLEPYGPHALLRSVVVLPQLRQNGLGQRLLAEICRMARGQRVEAVYLLTTSAEAYFAARGFARLARALVPERVTRSRQFIDACPASAVAMWRSLEDAAAVNVRPRRPPARG